MMGILSPAVEYVVRDQQRMTGARRYFAWQAEVCLRHLGRRVVEIGCGLGNFTGHLLDRERVIAIDLEPECVGLLRRRYADYTNLTAHAMDALDPAFLDIERERPDSVACLNVLEHISDDRLLLERMGRILPPGGRVVLLVPAFAALYGPIDHNLGHYRRYTKRSLAATARAAGLRPRLLRFMNFLGFFGWWANARLFRRTEQSDSQIAAFDRFVVPVERRLESWIEPPVGQSILAVLERP